MFALYRVSDECIGQGYEMRTQVPRVPVESVSYKEVTSWRAYHESRALPLFLDVLHQAAPRDRVDDLVDPRLAELHIPRLRLVEEQDEGQRAREEAQREVVVRLEESALVAR